MDPSPGWTVTGGFKNDAAENCLRMKKDTYEMEDKLCSSNEAYFCQWDCQTHGLNPGSSTTCPNGDPVPNDYFGFFGGHYKIYRPSFGGTKRGHDEAQGKCAQDSGKLITADSANEYLALVALAGNVSINTYKTLVALAGNMSINKVDSAL